MKRTFFKVERYSCGYDDFKLQDIGFSLEKGSFTGIIGPNGSGKTTLFKGISQSLNALSGEILLQGEPVQHMKPKNRARHIAIVSQFEPAGQIKVEDYVLMGRIPYGNRFKFFETDDDRKIAHRYMELTDMLDYRNKWMSELSGGEQQRTAIARALTQQPDLLLLDEPTAHLDITHQVKILDLLQKLNDEMNLTVLMVIHDLNLASEYCEKLILLNNGKIHTQGIPSEVLTFKTIEEVYKTPVITRINPYSDKPVIFLVSGKMLRNKNGDK